MILTDTHAHLYVEAFDEDRQEMMRRANAAGVRRFFIPAIDSTYTGSMLRLKDDYPEQVFLMMGLHPTHVKPESYREELNHVEDMLAKHDFVAVGEIGIDLYWDKSTLELQKEAFRYQIQLAKDRGLPIVIHSRESFDEIFTILEEENDDKLYGVFHCFAGTKEEARKAIDLGFKLGIGGVVTFKNGKIDQYLAEIDIGNIVLETDSPYLAPVPYRGKRNESAYLLNILDKLAGLYNLPKEEIAAITTESSKRIFKV